jgi:hypothetical protein
MSGLEITLEVESSKSCRRFGPLSLNGTNLETTLSEFVMRVLYRLEHEGKIHLPDDGDEVLVDRKDFRVCRANDEELDASRKLVELSYVKDCICVGQPLLLKVKSEGFLPTENISKSRPKLSETRGPPLVPDRDVSLEDSETSPDLEGVAGLKPMNGQPRPRSRHASKVSENDAMFILHQLGASQLTTSSSEESASTTSLDHSEGSYQRRQTMPIMNTELIPHPTRSNSLIPSVGDKDHLQRRQMRIVRTSSPLPRLVEESEKKSVKIRKLVKNPSLTIVFDKVQTFEVDFQLLGLLCMTMDCPGGFTVKQIKTALWTKLGTCDIDSESELLGFVRDPEKYVLKYCKHDRLYELIDEQQIFQATALIKFWCSEPNEVKVVFLEQKRIEGKQEQLMNIEISSLLGFGLYEFTFADNGELEMTRRKLVGVRQQAICDRVSRLYTMEPECVHSPAPQHILNKIDGDQIIVQIHNLDTLQQKVYSPYSELSMLYGCVLLSWWVCPS